MAREQGVVRPDVTRREVEAFKRSVRVLKQEHKDALRAQRLKLLAERDRILADLRRIDEELGIDYDGGELIEGTVGEVMD
jgi:hypothetical protein